MPERVLYQFCGAGEMPGGVQDSTNSVAAYMREQGLDTHVLIGSSGDLDMTHSVFNAFDPSSVHIFGSASHKVIANGSQNPIGSLMSPFRIHDRVRDIGPDVFHINAPWMPHIGGIALRYAQRHDIPTIATYHIVSDERITNAALKLSGRIDRHPIHTLDAMITVSEPARRHMEITYKYKGDVVIIPNGVNIELFEEAKPFETSEPFEGYDPSRPTVVFVGRPDPRKGLDELMRTFKLVQDELTEAQLIICGGAKPYKQVMNDDSLASYLVLANELGISGVTTFMGRVSDEDKSRWFASADVAALPATGNESQGIVLLEAMAAGSRVVLGGNNEGYASVFNSDDTRDSELMLVDPHMHHDFKERIVTLLTNDYLSGVLHAEQQELVRAKYDIQVVGRQILDAYDRITK